MPRPKNRPATGTVTDVEKGILTLVLREMRNANARKEQLSVLIDPFLAAEGAHVSFTYSGVGFTTTFEGKIHKRRRRSVR